MELSMRKKRTLTGLTYDMPFENTQKGLRGFMCVYQIYYWPLNPLS